MGKALLIVAIVGVVIAGLVGTRAGWSSHQPASGANAPILPPPTAPEERAARALLASEWPTASTVSVVNLATVWSEGNRRVVFAVFDAQNLSGAVVREKELLAFALTKESFTWNRRTWSTPTTTSPTQTEIEMAAAYNGWGPRSIAAMDQADAEAKAVQDKRVIGTETIRGVTYNIHDDGTRTIVRQ